MFSRTGSDPASEAAFSCASVVRTFFMACANSSNSDARDVLPMVAATPQSTPSKAGLLDRILSFFILLFGWTALARALDHFNFLGVHRPLWRDLLSGTLYAAVLVIFLPAFSQLGMMLRRSFRS